DHKSRRQCLGGNPAKERAIRWRLPIAAWKISDQVCRSREPDRQDGIVRNRNDHSGFESGPGKDQFRCRRESEATSEAEEQSSREGWIRNHPERDARFLVEPAPLFLLRSLRTRTAHRRYSQDSRPNTDQRGFLCRRCEGV